MANDVREIPAHSAEYFGDERDHWWNSDYLQLLGQRHAFDLVRDVLDVGCGIGHWSQLLKTVLPNDVRIVGVDREQVWVERAAARAAERNLSRCSYRTASAESLPFPDCSFDLVTCQTVLIHIRDPLTALREMARVARPGGMVLAAEPNNVVGSLAPDSLSTTDAVDDVIALARFQLICERGKAALGEGNGSVGDLLPGLFHELELQDIRVYLNDKASPLLPPYAAAEQRAVLEQLEHFEKRELWFWSRSETSRYFLAGGGHLSEFAHLWSAAINRTRRVQEACRKGTFHSGGGGLFYIVSGRKTGL